MFEVSHRDILITTLFVTLHSEGVQTGASIHKKDLALLLYKLSSFQFIK